MHKYDLYGYIAICCTGIGIVFVMWGAYFKDLPVMVIGLAGVIAALFVGHRAELAHDREMIEEADFVEWCEYHEPAEITLGDAWSIERIRDGRV